MFDALIFRGIDMLLDRTSVSRFKNSSLTPILHKQHLLLFIYKKIRNHLPLKSDNNAKIRSFATIDIQLREMHGYLHNCKHSIKFQDFH